MEDKPQSKLKEALNKKLKDNLNKKNHIINNDNKVKQSFSKRNKIRTDSLGKRTQNRGN
jgi:hypothetical protein